MRFLVFSKTIRLWVELNALVVVKEYKVGETMSSSTSKTNEVDETMSSLREVKL